MTQTGVLLCTCDDKLCADIDIESVASALLERPGAHRMIQTAEHICLPDGRQALRESIREHGLDPVIIAACPARFQGKRLEQACLEAGLPRNRWTLVDWREGCAWAHAGDKDAATARALDLVEMGIARAENARPVGDVVTAIQPGVLVIGGGIAGLTAARSLAERGIHTLLVEKEPHLGGQLSAPVIAPVIARSVLYDEAISPSTTERPSVIAWLRPHSVESANPNPCLVRAQPHPWQEKEQSDPSLAALSSTLDAVLDHPNIQLHLNSHVAAVHGSVGDYVVTIARSLQESPITAHVGAIVVATGAQEYSAAGLYRHDARRVVTLSEFERELTTHISSPAAETDSRSPTTRPSDDLTRRPRDYSTIELSNYSTTQLSNISERSGDPALFAGQPPTSIIFILCAGSRDNHIRYCSKVCCLAALRQAAQFKRAHPDTRITILYRDLYLLGNEHNAEQVRDARRLGIEFVRYSPAYPPQIGDDSVRVRNASTGASQELPYERLVLAVPLVPRADAGALAHVLNLDRDQDGFFLEPHTRVRPEEEAPRGIFICGSAHAPVDVDTAILQGLTAAAQALRWVQQREWRRPARAAEINPRICTGCAQCVQACAYGAIHLHYPSSPLGDGHGDERLPLAAVDPWLCLACGNCAVACPTHAVDLPECSDPQILAEVRAALPEREDGRARTLVFACRWSGFAAMELAGARRMTCSPQVRVVELPCSARLAPTHVLYALLNGAARVVLALCPPDECHFASGNVLAEKRIEDLRAELAAHGIPPERLAVARMMGDDPEAWVRAVAEAHA